MQRLLTADLTQGVCHEKEGCTLMPVPGAPSYALSNLEHAVVGGLTPTWFREVNKSAASNLAVCSATPGLRLLQHHDVPL